MSEVLRLTEVRKLYNPGEPGEVVALDGASLTLAAGEVVALVAPSGAGKSTLLHVAGLLDTPSAGGVAVLGQGRGGARRRRPHDRLRRETIGFVYQFHHLLPEFSALENVALPQRAAGRTRAAAEARAARAAGGRRSGAAGGASPGRALGRRAAARRLLPGAGERAAAAAGGRANRQPRPRDLRPACSTCCSAWCGRPA